MLIKIFRVLLCVLLIASCVAAQQENPTSKVTNSETAIKIGVTALIHTFGKKQIDEQQPFKAELKDDLWIVTGSVHCPTKFCFGGAAVVKVAESDGHIVSIYQPK